MQSFMVFLFLLFSFPIHGSSEYFGNPFRYCSNATVSPNSTYLSNLKILSSALSSNSSHKFYHNSSSVGQDRKSPNPTAAYGDFQCRGDLNASACHRCVATATANSSQGYCPLSIQAVIWLDECFLRYSNESFFSLVAEAPSLMVYNKQDIGGDDVDGFNEILGSTFSDTVGNASSSSSSVRYFATKEARFRNETVYTLAQCTGDLSDSDCRKCLRDAVQQIPSCCSGKRGGRVLFPSCTVRFELYPFYAGVLLLPSSVSTPPPAVPPPPPDFNPSPPPPSTAPPPLLSGKGRATVAMVIGIVVAGYFL